LLLKTFEKFVVRLEMEICRSISPLSLSSPANFRMRHGRRNRPGSAFVCAIRLGRLGKLLVYFFLVGEQLLDARAFLHTLKMRRDVGEP